MDGVLGLRIILHTPGPARAHGLARGGTGNMAEGALETCDTVFAWDEVRVWSRRESTLEHFRSVMEPKIDRRYPIRTSTDLESTVRGTGVVTITR